MCEASVYNFVWEQGFCWTLILSHPKSLKNGLKWNQASNIYFSGLWSILPCTRRKKLPQKGGKSDLGAFRTKISCQGRLWTLPSSVRGDVGGHFFRRDSHAWKNAFPCHQARFLHHGSYRTLKSLTWSSCLTNCTGNPQLVTVQSFHNLVLWKWNSEWLEMARNRKICWTNSLP